MAVYVVDSRTQEISEFPLGITKIEIADNSHITSLPVIPSTVEEVNLRSCSNLRSIASFSEGLKKIKISNSAIKSLPAIPSTVEEIDLISCNNLISIASFSEGLKKIKIDCPFIESLPDIPSTVEEIELSHCESLPLVPSFSEGLKKIKISKSAIESLPAIPSTVEEIDLILCNNLISIASFSEGLKKIQIGYCDSITSLPAIPLTVEEIDLSDCNELIQDSSLMQNLLELEERGCSVIWPEHWVLNSEVENAKNSLDDMVKEYKENNKSLSSHDSLRTLFHRFLTEGFENGDTDNDRGSVLELLQSVNPVLEVFRNNPCNLEWADEIAHNYLSGCVNQPVAGWSEISALASIAMKSTIVDKVDKSLQLIALQALTAHIASLPDDQKPGTALEVEAGNVLLREIHKRLLEEKVISEPWLAVPTKIRYESLTDSGFLREEVREERISNAYHAVLDSLQRFSTIEQKANFLCEGQYCEAWGQIAFAQQIAEIKLRYDEYLAEETDLSKLTELSSNREKEIREQIRELTFQAIKPSPSISTETAAAIENEVESKER